MRLRTMIFWAGVALVLALVFYVTGRQQARIDAEDRAWNAGVRALVHAVQARNDQRTALLARVDTAQRAAAHWHRVALDAVNTADSLGDLADRIAADTSDSSAAHWRAAYVIRTEQVMQLTAALGAKNAETDTLASALDASRSALAQAREDIDSLSLRLTQSIDRKECKVAWVLACPSRTTSFIVGVALGGLTVATVAIAASQ